MASVVITSLSEHRADGSVWITGTVDGVAWNLRWSKPLDISPGGLAVAQAMANEYTAVNALLTTWFLGKTVTINTPGGPVFTVVFSATLGTAFANPCAGQVQLNATVNGSGPYRCNVSTAEFLGWNVAGRNLGQIIAQRIANSYTQATGVLTGYLTTFGSVTPQLAELGVFERGFGGEDVDQPGGFRKKVLELKTRRVLEPKRADESDYEFEKRRETFVREEEEEERRQVLQQKEEKDESRRQEAKQREELQNA